MRAFTLIETIIAIVIFTILIFIIFGAVFFLFKSETFINEQAKAVEEARRGIGIMIQEIREAREGENGAFPIEKAGDKEFIFYSDVDNDGKTERIRYFLGEISSKVLTQKCYTSLNGGSCSVSFTDFLEGSLKSAQVKVSAEGDLGAANEYVEIFADSQKLGELCKSACSDCAGSWQGTTIYNVFSQAQDNSIVFLADASSNVNSNCQWEEPNHKMKANFEFSFSQERQGTILKKGIIKPIGNPPTYPLDQEEISIVSLYVRNAPPIFSYFDKEGNLIEDYPARLKDTKMMRVYLVVNVNPNRPPNDFEIESYVHLRNLKEE